MANSASVEDGRLLVRALEAQTYSDVISVFRAQGSLDSYKNLILEHLRKALNISWTRHVAEIRRATADNSLSKIATEQAATLDCPHNLQKNRGIATTNSNDRHACRLNPNCNVTFDWLREGCRVENQTERDEIEDDAFIEIADNLDTLAAKHNSCLEDQQNSFYNLLKLPPQKNIPEQIMAIFEKHLSPVQFNQAQKNELQTNSNGQKRKRQISSSNVVQNSDMESPSANLLRIIPVVVSKLSEKPADQTTMANAGKSKFSKKSIDVPILQFPEGVPPAYQHVQHRAAPTHHNIRRSANQGKRAKKRTVDEGRQPEPEPAQLHYSPREFDFSRQIAINLEDIHYGLAADEAEKVVKMETDPPPVYDPQPQQAYSANASPSPTSSAPPAGSRSEPNLSVGRGYSGITVKTASKSAASPVNTGASPGKQSLRAVFSNFHAPQSTRMAPELARTIGAGGQKVIVLPSSNLRRRLNIHDISSPVLVDGTDFGSPQNESHDTANPPNPNLDQMYVATAKTSSYNTKGAGSDVIVVRRTNSHQDQQVSTMTNSLLEGFPSNAKAGRSTSDQAQTNTE